MRVGVWVRESDRRGRQTGEKAMWVYSERERMVYLRGERFDWSSEQECVGMRVAGERERARAQVLIMSTLGHRFICEFPN